MSYQVTTFDLCVQGFERLRSTSEFILCAYPSKGDKPADVERQWLDDIQSCSRPDWFDYDAARKAVTDWVAAGPDDIECALAACDWPTDDEGETEPFEEYPLCAFLYIEVEGAHMGVFGE
jgi:hypothetical protein